MENLYYCYVDVQNVRMKAFFDMKKFNAIRSNANGGMLEMWFKYPPIVEVVSEPVGTVIAETPEEKADVKVAPVKKGKKK